MLDEVAEWRNRLPGHEAGEGLPRRPDRAEADVPLAAAQLIAEARRELEREKKEGAWRRETLIDLKKEHRDRDERLDDD